MWFSIKKLIFLLIVSSTSATITLIKDFIQFNLVGHPVLHKETQWSFDPNEGIERSKNYQEFNGVHGEKLTEKFGLGMDGKQSERLMSQKLRDEKLILKALN